MTPATASRRLLLRVAAKLLGLAALGIIALVLVSAVLPTCEGPGEVLLGSDLFPPAPGVAGLERDSRRLLLLRRDPVLVARLHELDPALSDPRSRHAEQPEQLDPRHRAVTAEFFVALDYDPDFGCPLEYVPADARVPVAPWLGGFHAPCSDSWFDLAGRVYRGQRTTHNLRVPPHRIAAHP